MTTHANPSIGKAIRTSEDAGQLSHNLFVFDFANTAYRPAAVAQNDLIQIGVVPAGEKLVPHMCCVNIPQLDANVSPTGDYSIGTAAAPAALKGSAAAETAVILSGEDFVLATGEVGDRYAETPIYLLAINAFATSATTGKIRFNQVSRPWIEGID